MAADHSCIKEIQKNLMNRKYSVFDRVLSFLNRIEKNKDLNCYNFVFNEEVLAQASEIQKKIESGNAGKLAGVTVAIKDILSIKDKPLTCSSKILNNFHSLYNATSVQNLIDEDVIILGKTNCDEFAMGSSNENSAFGPVLNPLNKEYVPGGSSGGSAVALAADLCDFSLGTDTGGSIRQPAAFCGVFGFKPSYGMVSRFGLTAFASSFDTIGPFTWNIDDIALVLDIIKGKDDLDSTSCPSNHISFSEEINDCRIKKVGIPKQYFNEGLDSEINDVILTYIDMLKSKGIEIIDVDLPLTDYTIAAYYILTTAEASSNLARYDGVRYGDRKSSASLNDMYTITRDEGFGKEVKRRIMLGTYVLSAGYYDAYYKKAQQVRRLIKNDFNKVFSEVDILLTPTTPTPPFKLGEKISDPVTMYLNDIYTVSANLAGIPALNIPAGVNSKGLPIGIQILANNFGDSKLLQFAKKYPVTI